MDLLIKILIGLGLFVFCALQVKAIVKYFIDKKKAKTESDQPKLTAEPEEDN